VRGLGLSFLVRRARSSWLLLTCVAVTVLLTTGLAAVLWTFAGAVIPLGAQGILAGSQGRVISLSGDVDGGEAAADSRQIRATLGQAWPGVGFQMESALWADPVQLSSTTGPPTRCAPAGRPGPPCSASTATVQIQPASLEGISAQATLTAGKWPGPPGHGGPVPVALPAAVAGPLHLTLGSVLTGTPPSGGAPTSLQVTGLFRPRNPASPYWAMDLLPVSGISVQGFSLISAGGTVQGSLASYGPAVVNPAAFGGALTVSQGSWMVLPEASAMARGNIDALNAGTSQAVSQLSVLLPDGLKVTSSLPPLLAGVASTIVLTRSLFTIAALLLLLLAGAGLVLAARLLAGMREEESALLRARGATRWQVLRPVLAEAVVLGAAAGLVGVLVGTRLTGALARLADLRIGGYTDRGITPLAWLSALAVLVVCVVVMAWPALRALTPDAARHRQGRQARLAGIAWAGADLALVALAAVAVWELRGYSAVAHPATGSLGIDPVVALAPALALAGVALIPLRGLPLLARLADQATDNGRRLAAAMVSWQIARRPIRQAGPVLLVVIATATTTLALAGYASWRQSAADQAAFAVGSDVRVDSAGALPLGAAGAITRAPGVDAATPASLAGIGSGGQVIALDASTAGRTILLRPDLSPLPLSALWQRVTPRRPSGLALPGRPDRLEILAALGAGPHSSAAAVRRELLAATVTAWIQDAGGATYQIQAAGPLPFDGRSHSLVFMLSGPRQASYGLRLLGLSLTYVLAPYDPASPLSAPIARLSVESLAVAETASGPFGRPFCHGACLAAWQGKGYSMFVPTGPPNPFGGLPPSDGAVPAVLGWHRAAGGAQQLTFNTGHDPSMSVMLSVNLGAGVVTGVVAITARPPSQVIPAIATSGYLAANKLGIGSTTTVSLGEFPATVRIVASVANFPTVFGQNQALIADLSEVNDLLVANNAMPLPVTRWWLSTADGRVPRLPADLGLSVTSRASQQAALLDNPLLTAPRQAMLAIGAAAVLLGVLGFSISVAASLRSRRTQSAVFAALGVGKNAQAGQLCLEQCALSLPAAAAGLLAGIGLAELMVPAITLTADAAAPVPWAVVIVPLGLAFALALVTAAVPVAAAALSVLRRPDPAAQLRAEAG
jgi:FtsX-like permease family